MGSRTDKSVPGPQYFATRILHRSWAWSGIKRNPRQISGGGWMAIHPQTMSTSHGRLGENSICAGPWQTSISNIRSIRGLPMGTPSAKLRSSLDRSRSTAEPSRLVNENPIADGT